MNPKCLGISSGYLNLCSRQGWLPGPQDEILANIQIIWESLQQNILQVKNIQSYNFKGKIYIISVILFSL